MNEQRLEKEWRSWKRGAMKRKYSQQLQWTVISSCHTDFTTKYTVQNREDRLRLFLPLLLSVASASASVTILVLTLLSVQDCGDGSLTFKLKISYSFSCLYLTLYCSVIQIRAKSILGIPEKAISYSFRQCLYSILVFNDVFKM